MIKKKLALIRIGMLWIKKRLNNLDSMINLVIWVLMITNRTKGNLTHTHNKLKLIHKKNKLRLSKIRHIITKKSPIYHKEKYI